MKKVFLATILFLGMGSAVPAYSLELGNPLAAGEDKFAAGLHAGLPSYGFSLKYRVTDLLTVQGTLAPLGALSNYGVRGLYEFRDQGQYILYGYGGVSIWKWNGIFIDETAIGFGGGAGAEFALTPKFLLSAELGFGVANFDTYTGFSAVGLGFGAHYRF